MGQDGFICVAAVVASCDDLSFPDNDAADGHISDEGGFFCLPEGFFHKCLVFLLAGLFFFF